MRSIFGISDRKISGIMKEVDLKHTHMTAGELNGMCHRILCYGKENGCWEIEGFAYYHMAEAQMRLPLTIEVDVLQHWISQGIRCFGKTEYYLYQARLYYLQGRLAIRLDDYVTAVENLKEGLEVCRKHRLEKLKLEMFTNIAMVYMVLEDYKEALGCFAILDQCIDKTMPDSFQKLMLNKAHCGICHLLSGDLPMAEQCRREIDEGIQGKDRKEYSEMTIWLFFAMNFNARKDKKKTNYYLGLITEEGKFQEVDVYWIGAYQYIRLLYEVGRSLEEIGRVLEKIGENLEKDETSLELKMNFQREKIRFYQKSGNLESHKRACCDFIGMRDLERREKGRQMKKTVAIRNELKKLQQIQYEEKVKNRLLTNRSLHDGMTALPNRAYLNEYAEKTLAQAKKENKSFGMGIIDIDEFKEVNDSYGHAYGDECVKAVAGILKTVTEEKIFCSRYGGDEFVLVFFDKTSSEIEEVCREINKKVNALKLKSGIPNQTPYVTVSQGVCIRMPIKPNRVWDFLSMADRMLYQVKSSGKSGFKIV